MHSLQLFCVLTNQHVIFFNYFWNRFGGGKGAAPDSFSRTLAKLEKALPFDLANRLTTSWSQFGKLAKDYRDCIQHNTPVDFGISTALMEKLQGVWTTSLLIPDNPEKKTKRLFQYNNRIDALTYGWTITNKIVDVATAILAATLTEDRSPNR